MYKLTRNTICSIISNVSAVSFEQLFQIFIENMLKLSSLHGNLYFILIGILVQCHLIVGIHQENGVIKRMDIATCLGKILSFQVFQG